MLTNWLRTRTRKQALRIRAGFRPSPRFRPRLEALDDRIAPAQVNLTVMSLADSGSGTLRDAILTADAGSHSDKFTIDFAVTGTIDLQNPLPDLNNSIAIQGPGANSLTVERATGASFASPIVSVDAGHAVSLSGLTIANGDAGGIFNNGMLTAVNITVLNNSADLGGGIFNGGDLTLRNSTLANNSAGFGGGVYNLGALTAQGSNFAGNFATSRPFGAGVLPGFGGAICNLGETIASGCTFSGNCADDLGGAIFNFAVPSGTFEVRDSVFAGNSANAGGAIYNDGFAFSGGTASATLAVRDCSFLANTATDSGGAIYNGGTATIQQSTLSGNTAGSDGGGVFNAASGVLSLKDCTVSGNFALLGADLFNDHGGVTVNDSVIGDWYNG